MADKRPIFAIWDGQMAGYRLMRAVLLVIEGEGMISLVCLSIGARDHRL